MHARHVGSPPEVDVPDLDKCPSKLENSTVFEWIPGNPSAVGAHACMSAGRNQRNQRNQRVGQHISARVAMVCMSTPGGSGAGAKLTVRRIM